MPCGTPERFGGDVEACEIELTALGPMPRMVAVLVQRPEDDRHELLPSQLVFVHPTRHQRERARAQDSPEIEQHRIESTFFHGAQATSGVAGPFGRLVPSGAERYRRRRSMDVSEVLDDLVAEQEALDRVVGELDDDQFSLATPSERWSVADQLGHLTYFDTTAALAIDDAAAFADHKAELMSTFADELAVDEATLGSFRRLSPAEQLTAWRRGRLDLEASARTLADDTRVEWYGPSMGSKSFLTARLMEVWAHGQDICDAVGASRPASDRLRHIAQLGFITHGWSYIVRGDEPPGLAVRVELVGPVGRRVDLG